MNPSIHPFVNELTPYRAGRPVEEIQRQYGLTKVIKLASNENPRPLPESVRAAIRDELNNLNLYPDSDNFYLRERIAATLGVAPENIIVGAGSVELIRMIVGTFVCPGQEVLTSEKTFSFYRIATTERLGRDAYVEVPMDEQLRFDLAALERAVTDRTKVIFLTNPNNPTGTCWPREAVTKFIQRIPSDKIVVLDNAYQEYVDTPSDYPDGIAEALARPNVIVLRTFSKIYGLAGLRVGYAIAAPETIAQLGRMKAPFNVSRVGQRAALAALADTDYPAESARLNRIGRQYLFEKLTALGMRVIPSVTNFLLVYPPVSANRLCDALLCQGVIVRPMESFGIPEAFRVTVGLPEENDFFLEKLALVLPGLGV
ncbi:MAG TPA: histidinol-phosphate transaminase [Candidatus Aminicenantes bacterium]|nr:histidinol-phosphate transaminase [Candidatus Aminicenantes bacterium]